MPLSTYGTRSYEDALQFALTQLGMSPERAEVYAQQEVRIGETRRRLAELGEELDRVMPPRSRPSSTPPSAPPAQTITPAGSTGASSPPSTGYLPARWKKASPSTTLQTEVMGVPYKVTLYNRGRGEPLEVEWLGKFLRSGEKEGLPKVNPDRLLEVLRKKGITFVPATGPASEADRRKPVNIGIHEDDPKRFMNKRVQMFERLLGGKAERNKYGMWKIGPLLAVLAALGLLGKGETEETT